MPFPGIVAVATATPRERFTQAELLALAGCGDAPRRGSFSRSEIEGRYLYIDRETFRPDESVDRLADRFRRGALELGEAEVAHSRAVLRRYGNMSSATVVFVLEEMLRREAPVDGEWGLMIALGPGFAAEGALLRW